MINELSRLQRALQHSIVHGITDTSIVRASKNDEASRRLGIYATAYRLRLQDALAHNFPMFELLVGTERFAQLASRYLQTHPSRHFSVRAFGGQLAEFLQAEHPSEPWLAEFARIEWALAGAFDALDQAPIEIEALAAIDPDGWPQLRFAFASCVQRLTLRTNAADLYAQTSRDEPSSDGAVSARPSEWLIWRDVLTARYRSMDEMEATALDALQIGTPFAETCELLFERYDVESVPVQAAAFLKRWISDGLIVRVDVTD
jgi:hypothetical protein